MKRKVVLALVAALTLTVGSMGTVFAMNSAQGIVIQTSEFSNHEHVWGAKEWVVDKEAWTETIEHPAETHEEQQWVVDKEAWTETIEHPEEGHYEHTCTDCGEVQNSETGEVITPGNPTDPETPGTDDPTTEEPETPDNTTDTGENKDQQNDNKTATADKSEKADTTVTVSTEKKSPKTGDSASLIYLATLAGSAVTGSTAFGLRRKFKK